MKNNLLEILKNRGVLSNVSSEEKFLEILSDKPVAYVGFDPTSDSLHLGNYVQINISNLIRKSGVEVIPVIGGATGSIGDPSGKSTERNLLSNDELSSNIESISIQISKIYGSDTTIINNYDFYSSMSFLDFLREVGKNFSINYMLEKESIKNRLESGISYTEFSYLVLQAYDFYYLNLNHNVNIQIGGSDQYGNITSGLELIRKKNNNIKAVGLTFNLLTNSSGKKFGKSEKGAIFLSKSKTSVYQMHQYFLNIADEDLKKMFCFLTCLDISEIDNIMEKHRQSPGARIGQRELSKILISSIHSYNDWEQAVEISNILFSGTLENLDSNKISFITNELPNIVITNNQMNILDLLSDTLCGSKSQAIRDIKSNSIYLNGQLVKDKNYFLCSSDFIYGNSLILRKGKKNYFIVRLEDV